MKKLSSYVLPLWKSYLFAILCLVSAIVLEVLSPQITKIIVNEVFVGGDFTRFPYLLIALVLIGIGRAIAGYYKEFTFDRNSQKIALGIREDLFSHLQTLSMDYFDSTNTGELMARLKDDVDCVRNAFGMTGMMIIQLSIYLCSLLYCMFNLNPVLTIIPFTVVLLGGGGSFFLEKKFDKVYTAISEENAELTTVCEENLAGVRTVKAFARELFEIDKFKAHNNKFYQLHMNQAKVLSTFFPIYHFIGFALPVACAMIGGLFVIKGEMDLGSLAAYIEYSRGCTWPLDMIAELANELSSSIASHKKLRAIADQKAHILSAESEKSSVCGNISFNNVSLSLEGKDILKDISFDLPKGKTLGIMGATGSGKSSIVNMLQRFYDPDEGSITIDGKNIKDMSLSDVRTTSAVVMQDVFLFSDTIKENIKMGRRDNLEMLAIKNAASQAQAADFIEKMDEQYETVIGERGVGLSGGQKQRISIARALAKEAPVLIFDDSTSALDMETEKEIQKVLNKITDSSKMIIAHRISAVRHADEIIYLDEGKIAERGTHEELMALKGLYYNTYIAQYPEIIKEVS